MERSTWTSKTMKRSTWALENMEKCTWIPKIWADRLRHRKLWSYRPGRLKLRGDLTCISKTARCVRKVSDLRSYLRVCAILRHSDRGNLRSSPHLIEPHAPSGASTS